MEIKVGEYIRTKKGNIGQVLDISTCTGQKRKRYLIKWNIAKAYYITGTTIVKHSRKIIDLIEIGDYVNGFQVFKTNKQSYLDYAVMVIDGAEDGTYVCEDEITSIVTHEQFESMRYKL